MRYVVQLVKVEGAPGLSRAMMSAFIQDPHWALLWPNMSLEEIIHGCTQRLPRKLITEREKKRHQKVVDTETGDIVGYARWIMPKDSGITWNEAQVAEPTPEESQEYEERWKSVTVDGRPKGSQTAMVTEMSPRLRNPSSRMSRI